MLAASQPIANQNHKNCEGCGHRGEWIDKRNGVHADIEEAIQLRLAEMRFREEVMKELGDPDDPV